MQVYTAARVLRERGATALQYGSGQGDVSPAVADGTAAPLTALSTTKTAPAVSIGGKSAAIFLDDVDGAFQDALAGRPAQVQDSLPACWLRLGRAGLSPAGSLIEFQVGRHLPSSRTRLLLAQ